MSELQLNKKTKYSSDIVLSKGDKIALYFENETSLTGFFEQKDSNELCVTVGNDGIWTQDHEPTHIKLLARAPNVHRTTLHGVELRAQGSKLWIQDVEVSPELVWAIGRIIGAIEQPLWEPDDDVITIQNNERVVVFRDDYSIKCGCVDLDYEQASDVVHWLFDHHSDISACRFRPWSGLFDHHSDAEEI